MKTIIDTTEPVIVECNIEPFPRPMPQGMFDPMPAVKVRFSNGEEKTLFQYYPDEITFATEEFLNLTEESALRLRMSKDIKYLQS